MKRAKEGASERAGAGALVAALALVPAAAGCVHDAAKVAGAANASSASHGAQPLLRPEVLRDIETLAATGNHRYGLPRDPFALPNGDVLFLRSGGRDTRQALFRFDARSGRSTLLLRAEDVFKGEETLTAEEKARRERLRLTARGFASFEVSPDGTHVLLPLSGRLFLFELATQRARELAVGEGTLDAHFSPDGSRVAFVRAHDVYTLRLERGSGGGLQGAGEGPVAVTAGGSEAHSFGTAEFIAQEELGRTRGYFFTADGRGMFVQETSLEGVEQLSLGDPARPDREAQRVYYPRVGKKNAEVKLWRFTLGTSERVPVEWDRARYPYVLRVDVSEGAASLLVADRLQQAQVLLRMEADGRTTPLVTERDATWVERIEGVPAWLPARAGGAGAAGFLWAAERDGEPTLELRNADGTLQRTLLGKGAGFRALLQVEPRSGTDAVAWVSVGSSPTDTSLVEVPLSGAPPRAIAHAPRVAYSARPSAPGRVMPVLETSFRTMPRWLVFGRSAQGPLSPIGELPSAAERPRRMPRVELLELGSERVQAVVLRPEQALPRCALPLPVIDAVYGGPTTNLVVANAAQFLRLQWLANATGAAVVVMDAQGTPRRGRDWQRAIYKQMGQVPLDGHIRGLQALGAVAPDLDVRHVGITGWSYGGYLSAFAALARPDVFRVAVAGAPVTDWLEYDTAYTERYNGLPDGAGADARGAYPSSSVLELGKRAAQIAASRGVAPADLLIVHGTADDNVFFHHSLRLVDVLQRQGLPFQFVPLGATTHMLVEPELARSVALKSAAFLRAGLMHPGTRPATYPERCSE